MPVFHRISARPELRVCRIEISSIAPKPRADRRFMDEAALKALADSIHQHGLLNPLLVRRCGGGYELIAGARRLRAMQLLGMTHAEAIIADLGDADSALASLIENIQRENLHFLDEAEACRAILREHGLSQDALARALSRSPSALANRLRLLRLGRAVQREIRESELSERHARALLRLQDEEQRLRFARRAAAAQLSVRRLEEEISAALQARPREPARPPAGLIRDNRLVINAVKDTVRRLKRIGVPASSRVENHGDHYDIIVTVQTAAPKE